MQGVSTWSLYIEPDAVPWWPTTCSVIEISPLLRELLHVSSDFTVDYDERGRDGDVTRLALGEIRRAASIPLRVALPVDEPLRSLCRAYLASPSLEVSNAEWARSVAMSDRALDRRFREGTRQSPVRWRALELLLAAPRILPTDSVTEVSSALGVRITGGLRNGVQERVWSASVTLVRSTDPPSRRWSHYRSSMVVP